jgi:DNA-binding transcriptional LysR family regulator
MEIYQVRAFVTAAKLGNVTRTAEALHLTQPAITAQIKALEEELGVALFDRRPGRISLTRAGEALLAEAEEVLTAAGRLQGRARELQGEVTGSFAIGTVADPDALRLGSLLGGLVRTLPLLEIKTRGGAAEELREQVALPASEQGEVVVWPHARVGAQLGFIYPRAAEHDPATVAALSVLRGVWGLP